jgi:hypothetical protein
MSVAASFNGGKSQVNFPMVGGQTGAFVFINRVKEGGSWTYSTGGGPVNPNDLDSNGYPTVITSGGVQTTTTLPSQTERSGNYVATWDGTGTIILVGDTLVSGSKTSSGGVGAGRYVFSTTFTTLTFGISAVGSPYITNLQIFHANDETNLLGGEIFGPQFKARLAQANFGVYRFLGWQSGNFTNLTTWASRRPVSYYSYGASNEFRASLFAGTTTNVGDDYSATLGSGSPTDKQTVIVKFNASATHDKVAGITFTVATSRVTWTAHGLSANEPVGFQFNGGSPNTFPTPLSDGGNYYAIIIDANTIQLAATSGGGAITLGGTAQGLFAARRQPTFNLNGSGAVPIKQPTGTTCGSIAGNGPSTGGYSGMVYDATLGSWLSFGGGGSAFGNGYLQNFCPPEIMVQLCAEMGAHPYFVLPPLAADPLTDFYSQLASYIQSNGPAWMIPRFEGPNELWNTSPGFQQTTYATYKSLVYGWGNVFHDWMGKVMSVMGQSVASVYGQANLGTKYQVICGVQTSIFNPSAGTGSNPRLLSTQYISNNPGPPQSPYSNTAGVAEAWRWVSHVCCNHYIVPTAYNSTPNETNIATANISLFTATISGSTLTVASSPAPTGAAIAVGQTILTVNGNITITALGTGTGGAGTYTINNPAGTAVSTNTAMSSLVMSFAATYIDTISTPGISTNYATVEYLNTCYTNIKSWASGLGVQKICGYEGGYGQTYSSGTAVNNQVTALRFAAKLVSSSPNSATGLLKYTTANYNNFVNAGGEFPSLFQFCGPTPSNNIWAVLEDIYQSPDPPQWTAVALFNAGKRRLVIST